MILQSSGFQRSRHLIFFLVVTITVAILFTTAGCKQEELQAPPKFLFSIDPAEDFAYETAVGIAYDSPEGISISSNGEIIIADTGQNRIVKVELDEGTEKFMIEQIWGGFGVNSGQLSAPGDVAIDADGNIYVSDTWNHRVQSFSPDGSLLQQWGKMANVWDLKDDELFYPRGIAVDSENNIYVVDSTNHRIVKYASESGEAKVIGEEGETSGRFRRPLDVAIGPNSSLFMSDTGNSRVQELDLNGDYRNKWGTEGSEPGQFKRPSGIAVDSKGRVYVADSGNHRVQIFDASGKLITILGKRGKGPAEFEAPESIAVGPDGKIYVVDWGNNRIQVFRF